MNSKVQPSWKQGFARNRGESQAPQLWDGMVGAWIPALGPTGGTLNDVSINKNNGTLTNMNLASDWVISPYGYALKFDGINDYVNCGDLSFIDGATALSIVVLVRFTDLSVDSTILAKDYFTGYAQLLFWRDDRGTLESRNNTIAIIFGNGVSRCRIEGADGSMNDTDWHHIVVTFDSGTAHLYIDGQEDANSPGSSGTGGPTALESTNDPLQIGKPITTSNKELDGEIAKVVVYNRALTAIDVVEDYADPFASFRLRRRNARYFISDVGAGPMFGCNF